jgi:hypothetical protein
MSEQANSSTPPAKKRGTGFPALSLRDAVEAIITIGQHGPTHTHDAAAAYMGHSTANSGAFRNKLAALRDWGLIARGDKDHVILSDLAQQLVLDAPDYMSVGGPLLLTAFESCRVFGMLYNDSAKSLPQDLQRFRTNIVMRYSVAPDQADRFLDSFVESIVYAGLGNFDGTKLTLIPRDESAFSSVEVPPPSSPNTSAESPMLKTPIWERPVPTPAPAPDVPRESALATPVALRQTWPIDGGEIEFVIRTPKALPPSIYALMAEMAEVAARMETLLKPATNVAPSTTDDI